VEPLLQDVRWAMRSLRRRRGMLGIHPVLGRLLVPGDDRVRGASTVAVISNAFRPARYLVRVQSTNVPHSDWPFLYSTGVDDGEL